jgi:cysteinyl-tRNA synthetase
MSLKVYNTLTGQKEEFAPLTAGTVRMYVCGVTIYDFCHIGHARSAMVFDVIRNYFQYKGYQVVFVKNITDVDDKIIKRALQEGIPAKDVAAKYLAAHNDDMGSLGIRPADFEPSATEHIDEMLHLVKSLVAKGMAYPVDGDVYYSVRKFSEYGKLSGKKIEDLQSGARIEVDERKQDPLDFALWKASKPGEPEWDSPWGKGRPGWHIECSAMACKYLGESFDIHGGGTDLIFPHHENEIAQSEAYTGKPFAKYWLHNGMLRINQEKMSKSLGNFFTIREVLKKFSAEAIRYLLLSTHYRSPLDYSEARLAEATTAYTHFAHTFHAVNGLQALVRGEDLEHISAKKLDELSVLPKRIDELRHAFEAAMDDDFNTAAAIGVLFEMLKVINAAVRVIVTEKTLAVSVLKPLQDAVETVKTLGAILGFTFFEPEIASEAEQTLVDHLMTLMLELRKEARTAKNWALADRIRNGLAELGIQIQDHPGGASSWTLEKK